MAKKRFLVVEDSFIGMTLIRAEDKKIVEIETDIEKGGMTPGSNLVEVDENDQPITDAITEAPVKAGRSKAKKDEASDLA